MENPARGSFCECSARQDDSVNDLRYSSFGKSSVPDPDYFSGPETDDFLDPDPGFDLIRGDWIQIQGDRFRILLKKLFEVV